MPKSKRGCETPISQPPSESESHLVIRQSPIEVAEDFFGWVLDAEIGGKPLIWELARRMKAFGGEGTDYEDAVRSFHDLDRTASMTFDDVYSLFLGYFDSVKFVASDEDVFAIASGRADADPVSFPVGKAPTRHHARLYSLAWHLAQHTGEEPFILPQPRIAKWLGVQQSIVHSVIKWLKSRGILVCVDETYSFGGSRSRAKRYRIPNSDTKSNKVTKNQRVSEEREESEGL